MINLRRAFRIARGIQALAVALALFFVVRYGIEQYRIGIIVKTEMTKADDPRRQAAEVGQYVSRIIRPWTQADSSTVRARPFLRYSALETLSMRSGACGEAARVSVTLLRALGIDAVRLNLANDQEHVAHTVVVYRAGSDWYILDTINGPEKFRAFFDTSGVPFDSLARVEVFPGGGKLFFSQIPGFSRFSYFDFSRLTRNTLSIELTRRPAQWISSLLESPSLLVACFLLSLSLTIQAALYLIGFTIAKREKELSRN